MNLLALRHDYKTASNLCGNSGAALRSEQFIRAIISSIQRLWNRLWVPLTTFKENMAFFDSKKCQKRGTSFIPNRYSKHLKKISQEWESCCSYHDLLLYVGYQWQSGLRLNLLRQSGGASWTQFVHSNVRAYRYPLNRLTERMEVTLLRLPTHSCIEQ